MPLVSFQNAVTNRRVRPIGLVIGQSSPFPS